jgi:hypothetical protein
MPVVDLRPPQNSFDESGRLKDTSLPAKQSDPRTHVPQTRTQAPESRIQSTEPRIKGGEAGESQPPAEISPKKQPQEIVVTGDVSGENISYDFMRWKWKQKELIAMGDEESVWII